MPKIAIVSKKKTEEGNKEEREAPRTNKGKQYKENMLCIHVNESNFYEEKIEKNQTKNYI